MAFLIQRLPKALQDYLGNTAAGKNPSDLLEQVRPTIDLTPFWNCDQVRYRQQNLPVAATYGVTFFVVPSGEVWLPLSLSAEITGSVIGESFSLVAGTTNADATIRVPVCDVQSEPSVVAVKTISCQHFYSQHHLVTAGERFYAQCNEFNAGGARTMSIKLRYVQLRG